MRNSLVMDKKSIREMMKSRRRTVTPEARAVSGRTLSERLFASLRTLDVAIAQKGPIAVYLAAKEEIDLASFISSALTAGRALVAPRWSGTEYELVRLVDLGRVVPGPHGILEPLAGPVVRPEDVCAWLVPGLAFTKGGLRLGYGGGWYDRLLSSVPENVPKIGVAYDFQVLESLPHEPHDIRLTDVVYAELCEMV